MTQSEVWKKMIFSVGVGILTIGCVTENNNKIGVEPLGSADSIDQEYSTSIITAVALPPAAREKAMERFKLAFAKFDSTNVGTIANLYAEDAYLDDRIHVMRGRKAIEKYFQNQLKNISQCKFNILDVSYSGIEVYVRWTMRLASSDEAEKIHSYLGMSHLRFNGDSQIVFHHDYWDFSEVLEQIPVLGYLIRNIRLNI